MTHHERLAAIRRIHRTPELTFTEPEWLAPDSLDDTYFRLLPAAVAPVTEMEAKMLAAVFGEAGEMPARPLGPRAWLRHPVFPGDDFQPVST